MAERWYLKMDGIAGESTSASHKDEVDVEAWSSGVSRATAPPSGGGAGAGKAEFDQFHFVSRLSKASPPLFLACAAGSHLKEALLSGARQGESGKESLFVKYRLTDVAVASFHQSASENGDAFDQYALSYSKIEISYTPQSASGKAGKAVTAGFDVKKSNKV